MQRLRCTLLADGSSDRALIPVLRWLLRQHCGLVPIELQFADLGRLSKPPRKLSKRIDKSIELYPCDILFVHRDAEREPLHKREEEIRVSCENSDHGGSLYVVKVVPLRMLEAWLLIDEAALRMAAGNPRGREALDMPAVDDLENVVDPKRRLHELLRKASGFRDRRRRLEQFDRDLGQCVQRLATQIGEFSRLRELESFRALEGQIVQLFSECRRLP